MIPNHARFLEAIHAKKKVCVRFYSKADNGLLDRVCAPLDYGPGDNFKDGMNRYWLWDYTKDPGSPTLGLGPQQIVDLQMLGDSFDPASLDFHPAEWSIPRDWAWQPQSTPAPIGANTAAPAPGTVGANLKPPQTVPANP
jgi:hypothetical protein